MSYSLLLFKKKTLFLLILSSFLFLATNLAKAQTNPSDSTALVAIYNATGGSAWTASDNWLTGTVDTWYGVITENGRVTNLFLSTNNLTGRIQASNLPFLSNLFIDNNQVTAIDGLPNSLQTLDISNNLITTLPSSLPSSLQNFNGSANRLTTIPALPAGLVTLNVNANQLIYLPSLPSSLISLTCANNRLYYLPSLPSSLGGLDCSNNRLILLPNFPSTLESLVANNNKLISLPSFPSNLGFINVSFNLLTSLPTLPALGALFINCSNNYLDFADLEPIISRLPFPRQYAPQGQVGPTQCIYFTVGSTINLNANYAGNTPNLRYVWLKNNVKVSDTLTVATFKIINAQVKDTGVYTTNITSKIVKGLTLVRRPVTLKISKASTAAKEAELIAYPNPIVNSFKVTQPTGWAKKAQVTISNDQGATVLYKDAYYFGEEINVSQLPEGRYILSVTDGFVKKTLHLVK